MPGRLPLPAAGYCRRDNRVYAECPLGDNWESCTLQAECLLLELTGVVTRAGAAPLARGDKDGESESDPSTPQPPTP